MAFDPEFLELFPHTVTLTQPTGRDPFGKPSFTGATPTTYPARVVGQIGSIRDGRTKSESPQFVVYVANGDDPVTTDYKIDINAGDAYATLGQPYIMAVLRYPDEEGNHHTKIIMGFMFHHQAAV